MLLSFNVEKQIITRTDTEKVVTNSMNYLYAQFSFSDEWTGEKTAVFKGKHGTYNALLDAENKCLVPWEILTEAMFDVSVFCGDLITANAVKIFTIQSGYEIGDESRIPTPEIYTQVINKLNEIEAEVDPEAIQRTVDEYLADKEIVTEDDVETIVSRYISDIHGIPTGGATGQVLTKKSNTDYDTEWGDGLESEVTILIPTNLFNASETKYNFRPSTTAGSTYDDGQTQNGVNTSNLIVCEPEQKFKVSLTALPSYIRTFYYDANSVYISSSSAITLDSDGYAMFEASNNPNIAYVCLVANGNTDTWNALIIDDYYHFTTVKKVIVNDLYFSDANVVMAKDRLGITGNVENILKDKKWAVIGDSFSEGDFTGVTAPTIPSGRYAGEVATYPYLIATRCGMEIQKLFKSGRTLANAADGTISDTVMAIYQNIAADADYLTIYIGINDSHHRASETGLIPIGTITDTVTTTFYGAYNTLLTWAITNRPNLHIGIIVSNGCETDEYRTATIALAEKYGIPYIDMNGDKQTPCMIRSTNASIDSSIRAQRTSAWRVSETNGHPNADCHIFESTFIENFLRSL